MNDVGLNMAAVVASNSFYVGGNWGFVLRENSEFEQIMGILQNSMRQGASIKMVNTSNGVIVFVAPNHLQNVISQVEQITPDVMQKQQTRLQAETAEFQNYLRNVLRGTCKVTHQAATYDEYVFAIYSCNNLHKIRLNGIEYPAFSLTVLEALKQVNQLSKYAEIYISVGNGFEKLTDVVNMNKLDAVHNGLEISSTMTGVFVTIRVVRQ